MMPLLEPDLVVGPWRIKKNQLVVLMPAFEHRLCAHMVLPVPVCRGCGIVTLGKKNDGATLGGGPGGCVDDSVGTCCCGWTVVC